MSTPTTAPASTPTPKKTTTRRANKATASASGVTLDVTNAKEPTKGYFVVESGDRRLLPAYLSRALVAEATDPNTGVATITLRFRPNATA